MPLEPYHIGPQPEDDTIIWKYFPRWQFDSLINDESLFFRRVYDFINDDPNEGSIPVRDQNRDKNDVLFRFCRSRSMSISDLKNGVEMAESIKGWGMFHSTLINCWTMRETESRMMWIAYAGVSDSTHGVAIRSTVGQLKRALSNQSAKVYTSIVRYIDYNNDVFEDGTGNVMIPILHKSKHGYQDENELRLIHSDEGGKSPLRVEDLWDDYGSCRATKIKVDLSSLLCEVVLSPNATDSDLSQITTLCNTKGITSGYTLFRHSYMRPMKFDHKRPKEDSSLSQIS